MKYRQSGMPEEMYWETLFDVSLVLDKLGIDGHLHDVIELGCGYGTFTIPVARRISGGIYTVDIDTVMVERTRQRLAEQGITNAFVSLRDVVLDGFGVENGSQEACLLFNILHGEDPVSLLVAARQILKPGGEAFVMHWRHDDTTPRGPTMDIRPKPEQCLAWGREAGFQLASDGFIELPPFHWGMKLQS